MTLGIEQSPYPAEAGDEITLTLLNGSGDPAYARWELILVPDSSELETGMLVDASGAYVQTFTPDVAGVYGFRAYDVRAFTGLPQFRGDASGGTRQTILSTYDIRLYAYVVAPMDLRIQTIPGHDITLRLGIANNRVFSAEFVDPATDLARLAGIHTTGESVMDALLPATPLQVSAISRQLQPRVKDLRAAFEAHRVNTTGSVHGSADSTNAVDREPCESDEAAMLVLIEMYDDILGHMMAGASGGTWHTIDDTKNLPITPKPTTKMQAHVTCCDLEERVYEKHRAQTSTPTVHGAADNTNVLAAPEELTAVIVEYLDFVAENSTAEVDGENDGVVLAERMLGMSPAP